MQQFFHKQSFPLEAGHVLAELEIGYHTYGNLNSDGSNVVWICHALTASSAVADWWPGVVGEGYVINPQEHFIVCANIIGSCYGSSGPLSNNPATGTPYYNRFPAITIRDMVNAHILLRQHLGVQQIHLLVGGSMGGYQALEWAIMESNIIQQLFLLTTSATESAWGIAVHTAQRMSIEADSSWQNNNADAGRDGLKAARAIGMLTYRNYGIMTQAQSDNDSTKLDNYKASSYIRYQGEKLANRFNAYSYWLLTQALDTHHIARGRGGDVSSVLKQITQRSLILGISSDILCPLTEQEQMTTAMPNAKLITIDSVYGHDGFLVEAEQISKTLFSWLKHHK